MITLRAGALRVAGVVAAVLASVVVAAPVAHAVPAGVNDWSCRPSAAHPEPVVLVHGLFANADINWGRLGPELVGAGYCTFALTYGVYPNDPLPLSSIGGRAPFEDSAAELAAFVDRVLAATGAAKVSTIGHSEGTLVAAYYEKVLGGNTKVALQVSFAGGFGGSPVLDGPLLHAVLAVLHPGIDPLLNPVCAACGQVVFGSAFLEQLRAGGVAAPGVRYTNIVTRYDELVLPYTNGTFDSPQATNITVQDGCEVDLADHISIVTDLRAIDHALNALDPEHPRPVRCAVVLPAIGKIGP